MPVYVDPLRPSSGGSKARTFRAGVLCCHLQAADFSPEAIDALHALAERIGLRRSWFQDTSWPHYDLVESKRVEAVREGAVEESHLEGANRRRAVRAAYAEKVEAS